MITMIKKNMRKNGQKSVTGKMKKHKQKEITKRKVEKNQKKIERVEYAVNIHSKMKM